MMGKCKQKVMKEFFSFVMILLLSTAVGLSQVKPGPSNTGYSGTLTPSSVTTITQDGAVIENVSTGLLRVQANNVTIRNCHIVTTSYYGIQCTYGNTGLVIEDCEIEGMASAGIYGGNFIARRLNIHDSGGDGIKPTTNCLVEYSWIHHLGKNDGAHADGVQSRNGGTNMTFRYNNFDMPITDPAPYKSNAAFILEPDGGQLTNTLIEYNWMNGGNWTIYGSNMAGIIVRNNIFGTDYRYGILNGVANHECNVWEDTGEAIDACGPIVENPIITPNGGSFSNPVTVSISCATSGAEIRYTLDGSNPLQTSTLYTGSFVVNSSTTITARAYADGMTESGIVSSSIVILSGTNIALGKTVTVSAYQDDANGTFPGSNLVDGDVSDASRWSASGYPQWVQIDLGSSYNISGINVYTYKSRAYQYIIEASTDGVNYTQVVDRSANISDAQPIADNVTTNARYIKMTVSGASGYTGTWVSINEIMLMGEGNGGTPINPTSVTVSPTSLTLDVGETSDLTETVLPANATDKTVTYSSNNTSVATVNATTGLVTAVSVGNATITVTTNDGGYTANCVVTVAESQSSFNAYYCDPVNGSMLNSGSQSSPWGSLQAVFAAGKTFIAGDTIYLMSGHHGFPVITLDNAADVIITKAPGHTPVIERISFNNATHWLLTDVEISTNGIQVPTNPPLTHPVYPIIGNSLVQISNNSAYITIDNCYVNSIDDATSWTANDWNYKAFTGVYHIDADHITISNNSIKNVNFGIHNNQGVSNSLYENNLIENFTGDGLRGHGVNTVIEYNTVKNAYLTNGNHVDMVQVVGTTTGLVLRGNKFFAWTDPNQPFKTGCQGIGLFDGMYYDFVIENNLVVTDHYNGITLLGAENCKIINNTVIDLNDNNLWIKIAAHKNGTPSSGNIVRNNLCTAMANDANIGSVDNNIVMAFADKDNYFTDFVGFDFHLKAGSPAIDAGIATNAPLTDIEGADRPQGPAYDVGAYEYDGVYNNVTGITLSPIELSIEIAQSSTLTVAIEPENASNKNIEWTSSNPQVAVVSASGVVTGLNEGTAIITATTVDGGYAATCEVTVSVPVGDYNLALFKPVTVTKEDGPTPGTNLVDGDTDDESRWSAEGKPQSAEVDLGGNYRLSGINVYTFKDRAYQYTVEAKAEGSSYATIVDRSANTSPDQPIADAVSTVARYVKITVTGASGYTGAWVSLTELEVYGSPVLDTIAPSVPTGLTAIDVSDASVMLNWNASSDEVGVTSYKVYTNGENPVDATDTTVTITGLTSGVQYSFTVIAIDGFGNESEASLALEVTTIDVLAPSVPTGLTLNAIMPYSAEIVWDMSADNIGVTGYKVYVNGENLADVTDTIATINGLEPETQYSVTVSAVDAAGNESAQSEPELITTSYLPINILSVTADKSNGVHVPENTLDGNYTTRWAAGGDEKWIAYELDHTGILTGIGIAFFNGSKIRSFFDIETSTDGVNWMRVYSKGESGGVTDSIEVFSFDGVIANYIRYVGHGNEEGYLNSITEVEIYGKGYIDKQSPSVPEDLTFNTVTNTSVYLNWEASVDDVTPTGYKVYINGTETVASTDANIKITGLTPDTKYAFTVSAFDAAGNESGQSASVLVKTRVSVKEEIAGVTAIKHTGNNVPENTLDEDFDTRWAFNGNDRWIEYSFNDITDITGVGIAFYEGATRRSYFDIKVSIDGIDWTNVYRDAESSGLSDDIEVFEFDTIAVKYVRYDGHGNAVNMLNSLTEVDIYGVGFIDRESPSAPTNLAVVNILANSVTLSWNASTDNVEVTGYKVYTDGTNPVSVADTTVTIEGLTSAIQYSFTVIALDEMGNVSAQSAAILATTLDNIAPNAPIGLISENITTNSVDLSWDPSADNVGVTGYKVYVNGENPVEIADTTTTISGLTQSTTYNFTVSAIDAAGNESVQSEELQVTTSEVIETWALLTYDDFESGWGSFKDGGGDCNFYTGGTYAHQGSNAAEIQDNQGNYSTFYYINSVDVQAYSQIKIEFWFYGLGMNDGHDFFVEYSDNGGSSWQSVARYIQGASNDFVNGQFYSVTDGGDFSSVIIDANSYNFTSNAKIRFRCDGLQNDDQVYIDEVSVTALVSETSSASVSLADDVSNTSVNIYPNPLNSSMLNIAVNGYNEAVNVTIYNLTGRSVYTQQYFNQTEIQIPTSKLNSGIYIISVNSVQQKLIVE